MALRLSIRGADDGENASWYYQIQNQSGEVDEDAGDLVGSIYELEIKNLTDSMISKWEADVYFPEDIYLNSGWNGDFYLHQNVGSKEKTFTFYSGKFDVEGLTLDYTFDRISLFINMNQGDYFTYVPSSESHEVLMDAIKVKEILINLLSNAVKYTTEGGTITFSGSGWSAWMREIGNQCHLRKLPWETLSK